MKFPRPRTILLIPLALFAAFFTDQLAIEEPDVLLDVASRIGLRADEAEEALSSTEVAAEVEHAEQFWVSRGIRGVPAMVFAGQHLVSGAQGKENYRQILTALTEVESAA